MEHTQVTSLSGGKIVSNGNDTIGIASDFSFSKNRMKLVIRVSDSEERAIEVSKQETVENIIKRAFS